jgi:hypothetical protein
MEKRENKLLVVLVLQVFLVLVTFFIMINSIGSGSLLRVIASIAGFLIFFSFTILVVDQLFKAKNRNDYTN